MAGANINHTTGVPYERFQTMQSGEIPMSITYAMSHIDGGLDCSSLSMGILKSMPDSPMVKAMVIAGKQAHPIWAWIVWRW